MTLLLYRSRLCDGGTACRALGGKVMKLRAALSQTFSQMPYLPRAFALIWAAARPWTIAWAALLIAQGFLPAALALPARLTGSCARN